MPLGEIELGDELAQIRRLADATEACLHRTQEETEQATQALKQVKELFIEQRQLVEQEKVALQMNFEIEKSWIQQEKKSCSEISSNAKKQSIEHSAL
jgi:hypothetical protein